MAGKNRTRSGIIVTLLLLAMMPAQAALPIFEQPQWAMLTAEQMLILAPLKNEWDAMDAFRRKKWLGIAERYRDMSPAEQDSIQRNMREWARLAPEERKAVREQYKKLRKVTPEQRQVVKQKWEEYSSLPPVTRDHMKDIAPKRPKVKTPKKPVDKQTDSVARIPAALPSRSPLSPIKPPQSALAPKSLAKGAASPPSAQPAQPPVSE